VEPVMPDADVEAADDDPTVRNLNKVPANVTVVTEATAPQHDPEKFREELQRLVADDTTGEAVDADDGPAAVRDVEPAADRPPAAVASEEPETAADPERVP
jgi:hypothetical protein